jgi:hypothetical protein
MKANTLSGTRFGLFQGIVPIQRQEICQACRKNCVDAREQCKVSACLVNGETRNGVACGSVTNQQGWSDGLRVVLIKRRRAITNAPPVRASGSVAQENRRETFDTLWEV